MNTNGIPPGDIASLLADGVSPQMINWQSFGLNPSYLLSPKGQQLLLQTQQWSGKQGGDANQNYTNFLNSDERKSQIAAEQATGGFKQNPGSYSATVNNDPGYLALQKAYSEAGLDPNTVSGGANPRAGQTAFNPVLAASLFAAPELASLAGVAGAGAGAAASYPADIIPFTPAGFGSGSALLPALSGAAAGGADAAGASSGGSFGGSLSSLYNGIKSIPSSISSALGGGFPGAVGSGAITGGATGALLGGIEGQPIGKSALEGAAVGGIGGGLSNFADSSGLSSLFGGTPQPSGNMMDAYNSVYGSPSAGLSTSTSAGAPSGSGFLSSLTPSTGIASAGGGAPGGFVSGEAFSNLGANDPFSYGYGASALNAGEGGAGAIAPISEGGLLGGESAALPSPLSSGGTMGFFQNSGSASSAGGGGNMMLNGLLRAGLGGLFSKTNPQGFNAEIGAGNQTAANYQPFLNTGLAANNTLAALYGLNGNGAQEAAKANWQNTPGYQFAKQQGISALDASAAAKGNLLSGNQLKAVQDYGTGLADQTYNNYLGGLQNEQAAGIAGAGGVASGLNTAAGGQLGKGGAQANNFNTALGAGLNALFPSNSIDLSKLLPFLGNNNNSGLLSLFQ